jgi:tetratricopeptide (TPR) repeat protein
MLAFEPGDRFADCGEALGALEACQADFSYRSQERQLSRMICDLFADDKREEEARLAKLLKREDGAPPNPYVRPDTTLDTRLNGQASAASSAKPRAARRWGARWRIWLAAGLGALLLTVSGLLWFHHAPSRRQTPPTGDDAFQARRFNPATPTPATPPAGAAGSTDQAVLAQQAQDLMATDPEAARRLWRKLLILSPAHAEAHFNLGLLHIQAGEYQPAIAAFAKVLESHPQMADALFNLGYAQAKSGQYDEAIASYRQAADLRTPYQDEVFYNLATVHEIRGDWQKALQNLQMAIEFNPDNDRARDYFEQLESKHRQSP